MVSYDSAALLERTLARVAEDSPEARIVVVDNYSTPAAREELVALASSRGWETVLPETNTGFGGGMNLGVTRARELGADEPTARYLGLRGGRIEDHPLAHMTEYVNSVKRRPRTQWWMELRPVVAAVGREPSS